MANDPYHEKFPTGSRVRIVARSELERFRETWKLHHPLEESQLAFAGAAAAVGEVGFYHGGDALYRLEGVPGIWHEACLEAFDPSLANQRSFATERQQHPARITWSQARVAQGLWSGVQRTVPAWFGRSKPAEAWSLACNFERSPAEQGNPSIARVRFLVEDAPHDRLVAGATLSLFEEALTESYAKLEILG